MWLYWIEQSFACGGAEAECDSLRIRAVNLVTLSALDLSAPVPDDCGVPLIAPYKDSSIIASCFTQQGNRWVIDATAETFMTPAPVGAPPTIWSWSGGRVGAVVLTVSTDNFGSLTSIALRNAATGATQLEVPLTDVWAAFLVDEKQVILLRSTGALDRIDVFTGKGVRLPYAIDPGAQGSDVVLTR
jgi:hypothetical protein